MTTKRKQTFAPSKAVAALVTAILWQNFCVCVALVIPASQNVKIDHTVDDQNRRNAIFRAATVATAGLFSPSGSSGAFVDPSFDTQQFQQSQTRRSALLHRALSDESIASTKNTIGLSSSPTSIVAAGGQVQRVMTDESTLKCVTSSAYKEQDSKSTRRGTNFDHKPSVRTNQCVSVPPPQGKREPIISPSKAIPGLYPRWQDSFLRDDDAT